MYRQQPHQAPQQRGFTNSVAPHQAGAGACGDTQINVPEDVAATIELIELFDFEH
jgi:hypothetical protein